MAHRHPRTLGFCFAASVALILILGLIALAFGEGAPEFPFKNFQTLGSNLPGLTLTGATMDKCEGFVMAEFGYKGDGVTWLIWASQGHLTAGVVNLAGFLIGDYSGSWLYYGTIHSETQAIKIHNVYPFAEKMTESPCASWGEET